MMQSPGRIVTFYSYKGGTGRSMALANFAWLLAADGKKVLLVDWDLEAPGLHRYLRPFLVDPDLFETDGLIDAFWNLTTAAITSTSTTDPTQSPLSRDLTNELLEDAIRRVNWTFPSKGYIDFVGAGRQGDTYSERVNSFDWKKFYEVGGAQLLNAAKIELRSRYDWVLIDSRTGVSDTSGICTMQLPDAVVGCFTMNRQSIEGVSAVLRSIRAYRSPTVDGSKIVFYPVATRIENGEKDKLEAARSFARAELLPFLPSTDSTRDYWDQMEIAYRPSYAFEEVLAAFGDSTGAAGASDTMLAQMEKMSRCITGNPELRMPEVLEHDRAEVLQKYALGQPGTQAPPARHPADGGDRDFLRGVLAKEQVWRKAGFDWRDLLSQREMELLTEDDRATFGRNMAYYYAQSVKMHRMLQRTERLGLFLPFGSIAVVAAFCFVFLGWWNPLFVSSLRTTPSRIELGIALYATLGLWWLSALLISVATAREAPQGIRPFGLFYLYIRGPFRQPIRDFEKLDRPQTDPSERRARGG